MVAELDDPAPLVVHSFISDHLAMMPPNAAQAGAAAPTMTSHAWSPEEI